jgi:hypothetical protein
VAEVQTEYPSAQVDAGSDESGIGVTRGNRSEPPFAEQEDFLGLETYASSERIELWDGTVTAASSSVGQSWPDPATPPTRRARPDHAYDGVRASFARPPPPCCCSPPATTTSSAPLS